MSDSHESPTSPRSEVDDELENGYESVNDLEDSLNLDEEEEDEDVFQEEGSLVGGSLLLHLPQPPHPHTSSSTATSLSDTASDNMSTHAVMGEAVSPADGHPTSAEAEEGSGGAGGESQGEETTEETDRVRRIHNSIFSSLEQDLAELVRIREETIQFLESGVRPPGEPGTARSETGNSERSTPPPIPLRERLTYYTRPYTSVDPIMTSTSEQQTASSEEQESPPSVAAMQARTFVPLCKFENTPPGLPGKPFLETGLASCDEKALAARKIMDKLQYGDPEDEGACFVRRFWRETSVVTESPSAPPLSLDVAALAQRTASLQASLEEAFDGLRLRLQQVQQQNSQGQEMDGNNTPQENQTPREESSVPGGGGRDNMGEDERLLQNWQEETSILDNPLNYDIWNEFEEDVSRINLAERRNMLSSSTRQQIRQRATPVRHTSTTTRREGAELDDDESTDDEEIMSYLHVRLNNANSNGISHRPSVIPSEEGAFFQEMGISDEMRQDLHNMFTFSEDDTRIPDLLPEQDSLPLPLFPRENHAPSPANGEQDDEEDEVSPPPPLPLFDPSPCVHIAPREQDEISTRVYLDQDYLDFPAQRPPSANHNEE